MAKWRRWRNLPKPVEVVEPLSGHGWRPAIIDAYGQKLEVMQHTRLSSVCEDKNG